MAKVRGWVYVISNRAMPDLVKVGFSTKDPDLRAKELNHTGSPHPYIVEYDAIVPSPRRVEQAVHATLAERNEGKEWFRCSVRDAVLAIRNIAGKDIIVETLHTAIELNQIVPEPSPKTRPGRWASWQVTSPLTSLRSTGTYEGRCSHCGRSFSVTLTRYESVARCPHCYRGNDASRFSPQNLLI